MSSLRLDWCSHEAATYAVMHWHYSKAMPVGKLVKIGVWEDEKFIGAVIFGQGNNQYQGVKFGLRLQEVCELLRVALTTHKAPVTRIVSIALSLLHKSLPGLRMVVSYADPMQGHIGGIYQAGNWVYLGRGGSGEAFYTTSGKRLHSRRISPTGKKNNFGKLVAVPQVARRVKLEPKHKYAYPLDAEARAMLDKVALPYPSARLLDSEEPGDQSGTEGAAMRPVRST